MYLTEEVSSSCPYCGEPISVVVDLSGLQDSSNAQFIEDCEVCCRPIDFSAHIGSQGRVELVATHENDA